MNKQYLPDHIIVENIKRLQQELYARGDPKLIEAFLKINSCLYTGYPNKAIK